MRTHVAAAAVSLALLAGCSKPPPPASGVRPVRAVKVGDVGALVGRPFPGKAKATQEVNLSFRVAGPLITLPVNVGDEVEAGRVIATLDPRDFEVSLRNIRAQLLTAEAQVTLAEDEYQRAQAAHEQGAVTDIELARKLEARDGAVASRDALQASVSAAEDALSDTRLKAPFAGTIVAKYVENFEDVQAKEPILRLLDDSRIEMIIDVPEHLILLSPYVERITVVFDAHSELELEAEIKEIGTEASDVTRTYPVTLIMDQPDEVRILPGMTGQARGSGRPPGALSEGIEIPVSAVASADGASSFVWVIDEESRKVSRREVEILRTEERGVRVAGLEPGLMIATAGVHYLEDGQQVRILDPGALP